MDNGPDDAHGENSSQKQVDQVDVHDVDVDEIDFVTPERPSVGRTETTANWCSYGNSSVCIPVCLPVSLTFCLSVSEPD